LRLGESSIRLVTRKLLVPGRPYLTSMYLLYLDESGDQKSWQIQRNYVLGGVAVHEGQVYALSKELDALQNHYFPGIAISIAFHVTEIRGHKHHFERFAPAVREKIISDVYSIIQNTRFPNLIAFATCIDISSVQNPAQVRRTVFEDVCLRFNTFLLRQYKAGYPSKGMLIIDENRAPQYRELIEDFKNAGTKGGYLGNIADIPYFARCHETRMLQLADFCSNAVFRYYERGDDTHMKTILSRFDRRPSSLFLDGLKHITKNPCQCVACYNRP